MKTRIIFITVCVIFLTIVNLQTYALSNPICEDGKIKRIVSNAVDFPKNTDLNINKKSIVAVDFKVNSEGKIVVNQINGSPDLVCYVKERLEKIVIKKVSKFTEKSFVYKFIFSK